MDMPEGAEGHSVASDGVGALIEGPKVAITQTRLYLDGAPGADRTPSQEEQVPTDQCEALFERLAAADSGVPDADGASKRAELLAFMAHGVGGLA